MLSTTGKDESISDVLLWNPTHEHTNIARPAKAHIYQLCANTEFCLEDLPRAPIGTEDVRVSKESVLSVRLDDYDELSSFSY